MCAPCAGTTSCSQIRRQERLKAAGLCIRCMGLRGDDGTEVYCRPCSDKRNAYLRERRARIKADREAAA
jgi:hypothetical protein